MPQTNSHILSGKDVGPIMGLRSWSSRFFTEVLEIKKERLGLSGLSVIKLNKLIENKSRLQSMDK